MAPVRCPPQRHTALGYENISCKGRVGLRHPTQQGGDISEDLRQQLTSVYKEVVVDGKLRVLLPPVQQLKEGSDCGVFSIAFLFHLALGDKPEELILHQSKMRTHLLSCLTN